VNGHDWHVIPVIAFEVPHIFLMVEEHGQEWCIPTGDGSNANRAQNAALASQVERLHASCQEELDGEFVQRRAHYWSYKLVLTGRAKDNAGGAAARVLR
jgi:hypothetical protein